MRQERLARAHFFVFDGGDLRQPGQDSPFTIQVR